MEFVPGLPPIINDDDSEPVGWTCPVCGFYCKGAWLLCPACDFIRPENYKMDDER